RPARGAAPARAPPRRLGVRHLHGGAPRPLPPARRIRPALLPLRRGPRPLLPRGAAGGLHHPRARGACGPRPEPERRAALRARAGGRGGEGRDALLRRARGARRAAALSRRGGGQSRSAQRARGRTRAALLACARDAGAPLAEIDLERGDGAASAPPVAALAVAALVTRRAGKPIAWNALRRHARGTLALFVDADVSFAADAFALLLGALAASPQAALASAKTTCAPRPGLFEGIMAAPYGVDFPNLS